MGSASLIEVAAGVLSRFDVQGVRVVPAGADNWAVLKPSDGDRPMPEMLAFLDAACTALQVEGGFQMSFGWSHEPPPRARRLPVLLWPNVVFKASSFTPLDGLVTDFCTRPAMLNRHYWEG